VINPKTFIIGVDTDSFFADYGYTKDEVEECLEYSEDMSRKLTKLFKDSLQIADDKNPMYLEREGVSYPFNKPVGKKVYQKVMTTGMFKLCVKDFITSVQNLHKSETTVEQITQVIKQLDYLTVEQYLRPIFRHELTALLEHRKTLPMVDPTEWEGMIKKASEVGGRFLRAAYEWNLDSKGTAAKRNNNSVVLNRLMKEAENLYMGMNEKREIKIEEAMALCSDVIQSVKNNELAMEEYIINITLNKPVNRFNTTKPPHVIVAERMIQRDDPDAPSVGDKIRYVVVKAKDKKARIRDRAKHIKEAIYEGDVIDIDYYVNKQIMGPMLKMLAPVVAFQRKMKNWLPEILPENGDKIKQWAQKSVSEIGPAYVAVYDELFRTRSDKISKIVPHCAYLFRKNSQGSILDYSIQSLIAKDVYTDEHTGVIHSKHAISVDSSKKKSLEKLIKAPRTISSTHKRKSTYQKQTKLTDFIQKK